MNSIKFDYVVDSNHKLLQLGKQTGIFLSKLCPKLAGALIEEAEKTSSARLYISTQKTTSLVVAAKLLEQMTGSSPPEEIARRIAEAALFLAVSSNVLARRYADGTLDPAYHASNDDALAYAKAAVAAEDAAEAA